jgi:ferredoxin-NADP reductase
LFHDGHHDPLDRLPARAGQFFQWRFLDGPGWSRAHPYSLSATPHGHMLRITVKDLGDGSAHVASLRPGTRALIEGPYGKLTGDTYTGGPVVLLACGIGVTPLLALLGELSYRPGEATLVYRARSETEVASAARAVTVAGPTLLWADVYATAAAARGPEALCPGSTAGPQLTGYPGGRTAGGPRPWSAGRC